MKTRHFVILILALMTITVSGCATILIDKADAHAQCQEDDPCWNWRTMGNHKRGIAIRTTNQYGERINRIVTVTAHEYCQRERAGQIIHKYTIPYKGDPSCRAHA